MPICMYKNKVENNDIGYIAGWGKTFYESNVVLSYLTSLLSYLISLCSYLLSLLTERNEIIPQKLLEARVPIIENCEKYYPEEAMKYFSDSMICAGYQKGEIDSCQGDTGGPLVVLDEDGQPRLAGVVSWGRGCALANSPGLYARIDNNQPFVHWAQDWL